MKLAINIAAYKSIRGDKELEGESTRSPVCVTLRATVAASILPMLIRLYWETATQFACLEVIAMPERERESEREGGRGRGRQHSRLFGQLVDAPDRPVLTLSALSGAASLG